MTKILFFVTPKLVARLGTKAVEFIPVLGPTATFLKKSQKITKLADPVSATSRSVGLLFNYCFGKAGAVSIECVIWFGLSVAGGMICNLTLIAVGAEFGNMIMDEFIE